MSNARIYEQGNGLPSEGDYCAGEGCLWQVESIDSRIQTGDPDGNWVYATVTAADWTDCDEGDEHTARVSTLERDADDEAACAADYRYDEERDWNTVHALERG
ncbi:MAG TPA: hypothetical protein VFS67_21795 [Polyangiaceae bacterium]|nr:hypothetical protein [Polyangiaceae bacterium]